MKSHAAISLHVTTREDSRGAFALMLHAHIPWCKKSGVWPAGEEWLFEAMLECYVPLLSVLRALKVDGVPVRLHWGVVPVLAEQLADDYMKGRFCEYAEGRIRAAEADVQRFGANPERLSVARYWLETLDRTYEAYQKHFYRDVLGTLRWLADEGVVEPVTSAATHGFLPLLERDSSVHAQVHLGVLTHRRVFGRRPAGFWLPECAYRPEETGPDGKLRAPVDAWLAAEGVKYFFVESSAIASARVLDRPGHSPATSRGYRLPSGVCAFGRDPFTSEQVWSPRKGYPGDPWYLDFHAKDHESGLRYWRVTGSDDKATYSPREAAERTEAHARHFVELVAGRVAAAGHPPGDVPPVVVAPYDCELFGHWWHEGPRWVELVFRLLADRPWSERVEPVHLSSFVGARVGEFFTVELGRTSWGLGGDFRVWKNPEHGWIWPYVNECSAEFERVLADVRRSGRQLTGRDARVLRQCGRELLLMQGSDWPFLLFTEQAKEYANQRFHKHHQAFRKLVWAAGDLDQPGRLSDSELATLEDVDSPWPDLDFWLFEEREGPPA
ncbi:MAG: 1,4-alpha-glucan branching protein [Promethearchaeota archaeon]